MTARHFIVHGRVQGVFFRNWAVETARSLGATGWVRNMPDGTVAAHVEGDADAVRRMVAALHEGPPRARVGRIDERAAKAEGLRRFERR
jgi:acylphosphatase